MWRLMMSQLNFYVPDDIEKKIRAAAQKEGKSISAYLAEIVRTHFPERESKKYFSQFFGQWKGEFPEIKRKSPQTRDDL
jgi:hypothetical protein